jgi:tetratricopeptide (TPR) repeat protein
LEENPGSTLTLRYLGEAYLATGRRNDAVSTLEKVVAIDDQDSSALFLLALAYEESGAYEKAILLLERLAAFPGVQKEVFYHLGMSYGKSNRLALAHYNFGLYFKALKEMQKAKFHFDKALEFSPSEPGLKEKILRAAQRGQG